MTAFPNGTHILFQSVPPLEPLQKSNAFLPVGDLDHAGFTWERFRRIKGPKYRPPGVDTHITVEFADSSAEDRTFNLSEDTDIAVVLSDAGDEVTFAPGFGLLRGQLTLSQLFQFGTAVFVPVGQVDYLESKWEKFALTKTFHLDGENSSVDFENPALESTALPSDRPIPLFSAVWETGQVIAGLLQGEG